MIARHFRVLAGRGVALPLAVGTAAVVAAAALSGHISFLPADRPATQPFPAGARYAFTERSVSPGMIPERRAISIANAWFLGREGDGQKVIPPNVQVAAKFGDYSDPLYLPRPAWVITYSNLQADPVLPAPPPGVTPLPDKPGFTKTSVILDGATGAVMESKTPGL